jgi:hypothetical protein
VQLMRVVTIQIRGIKGKGVGGYEWSTSLPSLLRNSHNEHMKEDMHHIDFITTMCCGTNGIEFASQTKHNPYPSEASPNELIPPHYT